MTCDDAFDQLTSPGLSANPRLARHLQQCARCRAMSETLAPALNLFAAAEAAGSTLTSSTAVAIASSTAARLTRRATSTAQSARRVWKRRLSVAVVGLAGAACFALALQLGGNASENSTVASCPRRSPETTEWMNRKSFPVAVACIACHPPAGAMPSAAKPATPTHGTL